jgi:hypothetical protein
MTVAIRADAFLTKNLYLELSIYIGSLGLGFGVPMRENQNG